MVALNITHGCQLHVPKYFQSELYEMYRQWKHGGTFHLPKDICLHYMILFNDREFFLSG